MDQVMKFDPEREAPARTPHRASAGTDEKTFDGQPIWRFPAMAAFYVSDGYGNSRVVKFSKESNTSRPGQARY